VKALECKHQWY